MYQYHPEDQLFFDYFYEPEILPQSLNDFDSCRTCIACCPSDIHVFHQLQQHPMHFMPAIQSFDHLSYIDQGMVYPPANNMCGPAHFHQDFAQHQFQNMTPHHPNSHSYVNFHHHDDQIQSSASPDFISLRSNSPETLFESNHSPECVPLSIVAPVVAPQDVASARRMSLPLRVRDLCNVSPSLKVKASPRVESFQENRPQQSELRRCADAKPVARTAPTVLLKVIKPDGIIIRSPLERSAKSPESNVRQSRTGRRIGGTTLKRHTLSISQNDLLVGCFNDHKFLRPGQADELAEKLDMTPTQIKIWYQNRRAYGKRNKKGTRSSGTKQIIPRQVEDYCGSDSE
ncbi:hypothetical protein BDR26DRAFT_890864 [Obelidium mucronatum]|nr:hypothetical protein BDR26DRAFT_890864 [Obelidium mucronatum]